MTNLIGTTTIEYEDMMTGETETKVVEQRTCVKCGEAFTAPLGSMEGHKDSMYCRTHLREHNDHVVNVRNEYRGVNE